MRTGLVEWMDRTLYPRHGDNWDDEMFRQAILDAIEPGDDVLDLGAGAGIVPQMNFRGRVARVCGVDLDPRVLENPYLDEARVGTGEKLPYPDSAFHVVFADNVLEHLDEPLTVFAEVARVLRPGGLFLAKTPNRWHYVATIARLTPHVLHGWVNKLRGRDVVDTFPTRYRANTASMLQTLASGAGLVLERTTLIEGRPEYLRLAAPAYALGWAYERLVNRHEALARFRVVLVACMRRPATPRISGH